MSISNKILVTVFATAFTFASAAALAQDDYDDRYDDADTLYDYAKVVDVQPLMTRVKVSTPQRECWDEKRYEQVDNGPGTHGPQVAGSTILGAAIGAVIGHQIGSGRGRDAATAAGAIVGGSIGHSQGMRRCGWVAP